MIKIILYIFLINIICLYPNYSYSDTISRRIIKVLSKSKFEPSRGPYDVKPLVIELNDFICTRIFYTGPGKDYGIQTYVFDSFWQDNDLIQLSIIDKEKRDISKFNTVKMQINNYDALNRLKNMISKYSDDNNINLTENEKEEWLHINNNYHFDCESK